MVSGVGCDFSQTLNSMLYAVAVFIYHKPILYQNGYMYGKISLAAYMGVTKYCCIAPSFYFYQN